MKKYRLIKEYPGSPKLGTIVESQNAVSGILFEGKALYFIETSPEYWEEIVEKNYEIINHYNLFY